jgi:hypothetical protein
VEGVEAEDMVIAAVEVGFVVVEAVVVEGEEASTGTRTMGHQIQ